MSSLPESSSGKKKAPVPPVTYQITIAYDGTPYAGWQRQPGKVTVQSCLEEALVKIWKEPVALHASGRTDTGVHALGQVASFTAPQRHTAAVVIRALNNNLPFTIRILKARLRSVDFHARFDAQGKTYEYRIWNTAVLNPFWVNRVHHVPIPLDVRRMRAAARLLVGKKDFASFTSNPGYERETTVRHIRRCVWRQEGNLIRFQITADGFLYRMVRNIAGALIQVGRHRMTVAQFAAALKAKDRSHGAPTAPACGLYLVQVKY